MPVLSDECYIEFTWDGPGRTIVSGVEGVLAVHSLSKRSNLAGARAGFYAGDPELVHYLSEVRKHAGFMVPGPVQAAAVVAFGTTPTSTPSGSATGTGWLCWRRCCGPSTSTARSRRGRSTCGRRPRGDAWGLAKRLAAEAGVVAPPGEFYGLAGSGHVRLAAVQPTDRLELVAERLGVAAGCPSCGTAARLTTLGP